MIKKLRKILECLLTRRSPYFPCLIHYIACPVLCNPGYKSKKQPLGAKRARGCPPSVYLACPPSENAPIPEPPLPPASRSIGTARPP